MTTPTNTTTIATYLGFRIDEVRDDEGNVTGFNAYHRDDVEPWAEAIPSVDAAIWQIHRAMEAEHDTYLGQHSGNPGPVFLESSR